MAARIKEKIGEVVSNRMQKTVVVAVETLKRHPLYGKTVRRIKKYKAHCEDNSCNIGDVVSIIETRPLSKEKRWRVSKIIARKETIATSTEGTRSGDSHDSNLLPTKGS